MLKELDNIFNECLEAVLGDRATVQECLERYPEIADQLRPLLHTSLLARQAVAAAPTREQRDRARYRFQAALRETEEKQARRVSLFGSQRRWAFGALVVIVMIVASGSTVAASGNSMPDGILYPVKVATESVRLSLTTSTVAKAELYASLADKRISEILKMADKGKSAQVAKAANRLDEHLVAMAGLSMQEGVGLTQPEIAMVPSQGAVPEAAEIPALQQAPDESPVMLVPAPLAPDETPPDAKGPPSSAPGRGEENRPAPASEQAVGPVETPGAGGAGNGKRAAIREIVLPQAASNTQQLREALENAPDEVRPALERALALAEQGYSEVLRNLMN